MIEYAQAAFAGLTSVQAPPSLWVTALAVALGVALIVPTPTWKISRNLVTIAHEGGHAVIARLCGRRLNGIRLHSDTSGVTVSSGNPRGLGMIATAFAGYTAPAAIGALMLAVLATGRVQATLWASLILLIVMGLFIRNLYGALTVGVAAAALAAATTWANDPLQGLLASLLAWFLLLASPKPVRELARKRAEHPGSDSDADQLATLTGIGGAVWVHTFMVTNVAAIVFSLYLLASRTL